MGKILLILGVGFIGAGCAVVFVVVAFFHLLGGAFRSHDPE